MQQVVEKLKSLIKDYYGFDSEFELKPLIPTSLRQESYYSKVDQCLTVPLFDPEKKKVIACFRINDVPESRADDAIKLNELISLTLQTYINLSNKYEITENIFQLLQEEFSPTKIVHLHKERQKRDQLIENDSPLPLREKTTAHIENKEILLHCKSSQDFERLAHQIHDESGNSFFIRMDQMPEDFLAKIDDLEMLSSTTIFISDLSKLNANQIKTLEIYLLRQYKQDILFIANTLEGLPQLLQHKELETLVRNFDFFYLLTEEEQSLFTGYQDKELYAQTILGMKTHHGLLKINPLNSNVKSYNIIPSFRSAQQTLH